MTKPRLFDPYAALRRRVDADPSITPTGTPAPRVDGGFGRVASAKAEINPNAPIPVNKMTEADARNLMNAEILTALRSLVTSTTELTAQIGRQGAVNGILGVSTAVVGTSGSFQISRPVTIGSIAIMNTGLNPMSVQLGAGGAGVGAPSRGAGLFPIPAGAFLPVPIGQKSFVVYGTAGDVAGVQLFTGLQAYGNKL